MLRPRISLTIKTPIPLCVRASVSVIFVLGASRAWLGLFSSPRGTQPGISELSRAGWTTQVSGYQGDERHAFHLPFCVVHFARMTWWNLIVATDFNSLWPCPARTGFVDMLDIVSDTDNFPSGSVGMGI